MITLGELIKEHGYTQKFVHKKLREKNVNVNISHLNRWCKAHYAPRHDYVYVVLAEVLDVEEQLIRNCFKELKSNK